ncbi:MAG: hypothetical protein KatS3mg114_1076 [Planctomycetaceae bacterium]|nr:MAG: hypothetical protein KatS3mg114_1076 [Planctomycetaceae bacterium]
MQPVTTLPPLATRPTQAHKGTFGRVWIVAGSRGMSGAAALAGLGALRGGAGLVTVAVPSQLQSLVAGYEPSYLTFGLPDDECGRLTLAALPLLLEQLQTQTASAYGPGLGRSHDLDELAVQLYLTVEQPMVFDADGLNALAARRALWQTMKPPAPRILTPHPGEFQRLTGLSMQEIATHRVELAVKYAHAWQVTLVLKGAGSVITDGVRYAINPTGNPGMATGGTGDVLTGVIVALLAQGVEPFAAAQWGAYLHGLAGDLAARELSQPGLIASDVVRYLPSAWLQATS